MRAGGFILALAVTVCLTGVSARSANAAPFVVHATANSQQLGAFNITRTPTLQGAISVFGEPDDCTLRSWFALAVWRSAGFRLRITTLGGLPTGETFCTVPREVKIDSVIVTGKRWHTRRGLFIGDSITKFHRLYPTARRFWNGWGITSVYQRCVIGVCPASYVWVPRLTAAFRNGRVASFVVPVGAQGE
jgi:hypothetical protein